MTVPTREINLPPADMLGLLGLIEQDWQLISVARGAKVTTFNVNIEGSSTAHMIALRDDGTWTARMATKRVLRFRASLTAGGRSAGYTELERAERAVEKAADELRTAVEALCQESLSAPSTNSPS